MPFIVSISNIIVSLSIMITGFFGGLGNAVFSWDEPETTVTDPAKVVAVYKEIAAKNADTRFRERVDFDLLAEDSEMNWFQKAIAWPVLYLINPNISYGIEGDSVCGAYQNLKASDLKSAKADYYKNGKTVIITMELKDQTDYLDGKSTGSAVTSAMHNTSLRTFNSVPEQNARAGFTLKNAEARYENARVEIRADVASGKIVAAKYTYHQTVTAVRNETAAPFVQSFNYIAQRP